jgi:hypothetical protein
MAVELQVKTRIVEKPPSNRMQLGFGELALASATDARRYAEKET